MPPSKTKPILEPLKTPKGATFPSEIQSATPSTASDVARAFEPQSTPITPPLAYTEFLKSLTPVLTSPMASAVSFSSEKGFGKASPTSAPSTASSGQSNCPESQKSPGGSLPPPSPFVHVKSAKIPTTLRRLRIPVSPSVYSSVGESPRSSSIIRSPFSASEWALDKECRYFDSPRSACTRPVSVRQVVTRTVTYKRTPLDPAPKGKRRKTNE